MEKIKGVALSETWEAMHPLERYKIIDQIVEIEQELSNISSPAYGSLFLRDYSTSDISTVSAPSRARSGRAILHRTIL